MKNVVTHILETLVEVSDPSLPGLPGHMAYLWTLVLSVFVNWGPNPDSLVIMLLIARAQACEPLVLSITNIIA